MGIEKDLRGMGLSLYLAVNSHPAGKKVICNKAGYQVNTFYAQIKKNILDFKILAKYGQALNYDFSIEYPEMALYFPFEEKTSSPRTKEAQYDTLNAKYLNLLEKHTKLQEAYSELQQQLILLQKK